MPCYSPLHGFKGRGKDPSKNVVVFKRSESFRGEKIDLPCGQCVGCRLERSRQWAVRCMHEASLYEKNSFLTLTYDDAHLPSGKTLVKTEFPDFMKRLRFRYGASKENPIRYYHCGEYGDVGQRPHYHAILFNHDFEDKKEFSSRNGNKIFTSEILQNVWKKGFAVIGDVTFESAAYVARYVMKKVTGKNAADHYNGRVPEFTTMSRRPGIGSEWLKKYESDVYPVDRVVVRGFDTRPPRFYDTELAKKDPALVALLKIKREQKNGTHYVDDVDENGKLVRVSDSAGFRLLVKEEVKKAEIKNLIRPLEVSLEVDSVLDL